MNKLTKTTTLTSIGIDRQTNKLIDKLCKRYSLKKGEIVKLAFGYMDKACINPKEAPESTKAELAKINKRQDDLIRFIRHYEEQQLNPMIRTTNAIAVRFDDVVKSLKETIDAEIRMTKEAQKNLIDALNKQLTRFADTITEHSKVINSQIQREKNGNKKLMKLISLYADLSSCGIMDTKRKENLKEEIMRLTNS